MNPKIRNQTYLSRLLDYLTIPDISHLALTKFCMVELIYLICIELRKFKLINYYLNN